MIERREREEVIEGGREKMCMIERREREFLSLFLYLARPPLNVPMGDVKM